MSSNLNRFHLYLAACVVNIASFALGCAMTWTSPSLPKLQDKASSWLFINDDEASWITSLYSLGNVFGPFGGAFLVNSVGRKWTINLAVTCIIISYILILLTPFTLFIGQLYISRFISGFGGGLIYTSIPTYVGEVSDNIARASLGSFFALFLVPGYLVNYCLGPWISYTALSIISIIPAAFVLIAMIFMPESPYYLIQKEKSEEALKSLVWFRQGLSDSEVKEEFSVIQVSVEQAMRDTGNIKDLLSTRGNRMGFFIASSLAAFQQLSGINVILFYGQTIFQLTGANFSPSISTIIIGVVIFIAAATAPVFARLFGIKNCLLVSGAGMTVFQSVLGLYLYYHFLGYNMNGFDWLPVTSLICYITAYATGFGPLPWAVMSEVFPSNVKPIASCLTVSYCYLINFILAKIFSLVNIYVIFMIFAFFCLLAFIFAIFLVPDTRGMSFQEIQDLLNKRNKTANIS